MMQVLMQMHMHKRSRGGHLGGKRNMVPVKAKILRGAPWTEQVLRDNRHQRA